MPINTFREPLTCFPNVKSFTFFTLELVYQVGGFAFGKGGDGISEAGVGTGERLGGDVSLLHLESPAMSTGSSQVGAALSPSF